MSSDISINSLGQPFGKILADWKIPEFPETKPIVGNSCRLEVLSHVHAADLWSSNCFDVKSKNWNYLPYGPFEDFATYEDWVKSVAVQSDPMYFAIIDLKTEKAIGVSAYTFIAPEMGSIEIGHLNFSPLMQRSIRSTETIFLMIKNAFSIGFRRVVWRSHSLNAASISAANRFGFKFECFFKNYSVMKGHNRNNVWFSIIEEDWPALKNVYENWMKLALQGKHQSLRTMIGQLPGYSSATNHQFWKEIPEYQNRLKDHPNFEEEFVINELGLPVGKPISNWQPPPPPPQAPMIGQSCRLEPLSSKHIRQLWESFSLDKEGHDWTYVLKRPFEDFETFENYFKSLIGLQDPIFHAVIDLITDKAVGTASYRLINCEYGSIEIGGLFFSRLMQRTTLSTETIILMTRRVFELGYRRFQWRCNVLNSRSVSAAIRYGFCFEGIFRNELVVRGCNRDTAWFSITDEEWPKLDQVYKAWFENVNRNEHKSLSSMVALLKKNENENKVNLKSV